MKLTNRETADLCRRLTLLLHAGIGLADSVFLLAGEETSSMKTLLQELGEHLDGGGRLSEAMERSSVFPSGVSAMVGIGEETGTLEETLSHLAAYYDQRHRTARRIRSALAYPSLILLLMLGVVGVLLMYVLPVFENVYASLGSGMTGLSAGLLVLGQGLQRLLPVIFGVLAVLAVDCLALTLHAGLRESCVSALRSRFGDRGVYQKFSNARFARGLAMGMASGLSVEESVALAGKLLSDIPGAARRCAICMEKLQQGEALSDALAEACLLAPAQSRMLSVGILGGNGDRVMADIAERTLEEAEEQLDSLVSRVEPAMVLAASLLVGVILLSVMLPLVNIMSTIG